MMHNLKHFFISLFVGSIFSSILFYIPGVNYRYYLIIFFCVFAILIIVYPISRNKKLWLTICIPAIIAFALIHFFSSNCSCCVWYIIAALSGLAVVIEICRLIAKNMYKNKKAKELPNYFFERKYDLDKIEEYLEKINVVGINAPWGGGKTYLFNILKSRLNEKFHFVTIEAMASTVDSIESYFISELGHALENNGYFSTSTTRIKRLLKDSSWSWLANFLWGQDSYTNLIQSLKSEICRLDKKLLIAIEDLDRVSEKSIVEKIFYLSEQLTSLNENIKVLFLYNENNLLNLLQQDRYYIEKYIPYVVDLTPVSLRTTIERVYENEKRSLPNIDTKILKDIFTPFYTEYYTKKLFNADLTINFVPNGVNIRRVKLYLNDVNSALDTPPLKQNARAVYAYYFTKHFVYEIYKKIDVATPFSKLKLFNWKGESIAIKDIPEMQIQDSQRFMEDIYNETAFALFRIFDYKLDVLIDREMKKFDDNFENIKVMKSQEHNDKIDRLIRYLRWRGKSEYTDLENARLQFIEHVLNKNDDNLEANFHAFMESLYHNLSSKRDNRTIMRYTVDWFYTLLPAFVLHEEDSSVFNRLLDFYIKKENVHTISYELIKSLNLCWGIRRDVYLHILKIFNEQNIVGNMNANPEYQKFLVLFLNGMSRYGFVDTRNVGLLEEKDFKIIGNDEKLNYLIFDSLTEKLQNLKQNVTESVRKDIDTMISFVEKNKKMVNTQNEMNPPPKKDPFEISFVPQNFKKELEMVKSAHLSNAEFDQYVDAMYRKEEFSVDCVRFLMQQKKNLIV
ncbi:MAG: hypothetical protein IJM92_19980 [Fibrobacter sp.]|uniref:P-loop NTPase fold protein n=1 Tax=Fibrobacter sp. TaxID=35828 RepID=UPI0025C23EF1|nr:P-loop NTPase fold protein [Fibrobacter sp.]MBQ3714304.1 hypothetical protein [Fibrobacter sp.]MBQ7081895.1 hypothetical protein [Fibrobacter sp.]